jgi:tripartite-type tricarboxylate transporter receptor subunit TctC
MLFNVVGRGPMPWLGPHGNKARGEDLHRRLKVVLAMAGLALALVPANAADYPSRRITLIAPWPPAGAIDTLCRELAPGVGDLLGQPVVVENRPGEG